MAVLASVESRIALDGKTSNSGNDVPGSFSLMSGRVPAAYEQPLVYGQDVEPKLSVKATLELSTTQQNDGLTTMYSGKAATSID